MEIGNGLGESLDAPVEHLNTRVQLFVAEASVICLVFFVFEKTLVDGSRIDERVSGETSVCSCPGLAKRIPA